MAVPLTNKESSGFLNHWKLALARDPGPHKKNFLEKAGDFMLWGVYDFPEKVFINTPNRVWNILQNPIANVLTLAGLGTIAVNGIFYPQKNLEVKEYAKHFFSRLSTVLTNDFEKFAENQRAKKARRKGVAPEKLAPMTKSSIAKTAAYYFCQMSLAGLVCRTLGRFKNEELMSRQKPSSSN
jgi:hypothetical protein